MNGTNGTNGTNGVSVPGGGITGQLVSCAPGAYDFTGYLVHVPGRAFSLFTGSNGEFRIDNMAAGSYDLSIEFNGEVLTVVNGIQVSDTYVTQGAVTIGNCEPPPGVCQDGQTRSCYSGPAGSAGVGICHAGLQTCTAGAWGVCSTQVMPQAEMCNGLDDDCDGIADEGVPGVGESCSSGIGACGVGITACSQGLLVCAATVSPSPEVCNEVDDDCDGSTDESGVCELQCPGGTKSCGDHCVPLTGQCQ